MNTPESSDEKGGKPPDSHLGDQSAPDRLAEELVDRCIELLRPRDWAGRLDALMQMHDQVREDFEDFDLFCNVFPIFIARLIHRLGVQPIESLPQAHIYANSALQEHRDAAGAWLSKNS